MTAILDLEIKITLKLSYMLFHFIVYVVSILNFKNGILLGFYDFQKADGVYFYLFFIWSSKTIHW